MIISIRLTILQLARAVFVTTNQNRLESLLAGSHSKMLIGKLRGDPSVWRMIEKTNLDQVWLDYFLDRISVFMNGC